MSEKGLVESLLTEMQKPIRTSEGPESRAQGCVRVLWILPSANIGVLHKQGLLIGCISKHPVLLHKRKFGLTLATQNAPHVALLRCGRCLAGPRQPTARLDIGGHAPSEVRLSCTKAWPTARLGLSYR